MRVALRPRDEFVFLTALTTDHRVPSLRSQLSASKPISSPVDNRQQWPGSITRFWPTSPKLAWSFSSSGLSSPPAGYVPKFALFLRNSQISNFPYLAERQKPHFSMDGSFSFFGVFFGSKKDNLACSSTT
jgi:hypothetical protein